jgi:inorganic pyrophosphatase
LHKYSYFERRRYDIQNNYLYPQTKPAMKNLILLFASLLSFTACQKAPEAPLPPDPRELSAFTESGSVHAVIEIPAGTNHKIEFDKASGSFQTDQRNGRDRVIDFLPYPGNYGFIPGTMMSESEGGDGDALDVLVISESQATGEVLEVRPIALLQLRDEGELDTKVIAIPVDSSLQVIRPKDFLDFSLRYDGAKHIIENWFLYYDGLGTATFEGWKDERAAKQAIERWSTSTK